MEDPYKVLGVTKEATTAEISKAYRLKSLVCHPDRNVHGTEDFKKLGAAYEILKDSEKRAVYDATGLLEGHEGNSSPNLQNEDIAKLVADFYGTYRNSLEEEEDIQKAYAAAKGNFAKMITEHLLFQNGVGEISRLLNIVKRMLQDNTLQSTPSWERSSKDEMIARLKAKMKREREEAAEALDEYRATKISFKPSSDMASVMALIQSRHQTNANAFHSQLDDMERRYGGKGKRK